MAGGDSGPQRYAHLGLNLPDPFSGGRSQDVPPASSNNSRLSNTQVSTTATLAPVSTQASTPIGPAAQLTKEKNRADEPARPNTGADTSGQQAQRRLARITQLETELAVLKAAQPPVPTQQTQTPSLTMVPTSASRAPSPSTVHRLFEDDVTVLRIKEAFNLGKDDNKKRVLPDVVPGFKASALDLGKSSPLSFNFPPIAIWLERGGLCPSFVLYFIIIINTGIASAEHGAKAADGSSGSGIARPT